MTVSYRTTAGFPWWKPEETGGWLKIYANAERRLYNVNMNTDEWEEIEIKFDKEELESHEAGFGAWSETLGYACMENAINSLDRFLDVALCFRQGSLSSGILPLQTGPGGMSLDGG